MEKPRIYRIWKDEIFFSFLQTSYLWCELDPPETKNPAKPANADLDLSELRTSDFEKIQADFREQSLNKKRHPKTPGIPRQAVIAINRFVKAISGKKLKAYWRITTPAKATRRPTYDDIYFKREDLKAYAISVNRSPSFLFPEGGNPIEELRRKKQIHIRDRVKVIEEIWKAIKKKVGYSERLNMDIHEARKRKREVALETLKKVDKGYALFKPEFFNKELFEATPGQERRDFVSKLLQRSLRADGIDRIAFRKLGAKKGQIDSFRRVGLFDDYKEIYKNIKKATTENN